VKLWPDAWRRKPADADEQRYGMDDYISWINAFSWNGSTYMPSGVQQTLTGDVEPPATGFTQMAAAAFGGNAVTFACLAVRQLVFSAIRFQWQQMNGGRPSKMFGTQALRVFEVPWMGGTTQDLLNRMIQDADLAGNWYGIPDTPITRIGGDGGTEIVRLRPDWVEHVLEPRIIRGGQVGYRRLGIRYTEDGPGRGGYPVVFGPGEFAHFAPIPDPMAQWRGMSWLTPVARELQADAQMTRHKQKYFENGATPNIIVTYPVGIRRADVEPLRKLFADQHEGIENAYKTLHLGGGADATVVGNSMEQISFKAIQGAGETRIAAAAGVPPVVVGLSEGLSGSSLNAGNYASSRRRLADITAHPLWQNASGSLAPLITGSVKAPPGVRDGSVRLWYDARDVPFLREDEKDSAEIQGKRAATLRTYTDAGFTPESALAALTANDETLLVHSGLFSVQLQAPGTKLADPNAVAPAAAPAGGKTP
jgi:hypothetical protein